MKIIKVKNKYLVESYGELDGVEGFQTNWLPSLKEARAYAKEMKEMGDTDIRIFKVEGEVL